MRLRIGWLLAPVSVALAASCGTSTSPPIATPQPTGATSATAAAPAPPAAIPTSVDIPTIGAHAKNLQPLGLATDGTIQVPSVKTPQVMGFYTRGGHACDPGPSKVPFAVLGHIDGSGQEGALFNLKRLNQGDTVTVGLSNGKSCTYRITKLARVSKAAFPTQEIWGPVPSGEIRVISCGGKWVGGKYGYQDNLVGEGTLIN